MANDTLEDCINTRRLEHLSTKMSSKRPLEPDDGYSGDSKRIRSNNGSPAPTRTQDATSQNGESEIDRKKREAAERMAAVKARLAASKTGTATPSQAPAAPIQSPAAAPNGSANDVEAKKAEAQRKIAEMKARMAAKRGEGQVPVRSTGSPVNGGMGDVAPPNQQSEREARIAEARARAAELSRQRNTGTPPSAPVAQPPRQEGRTARGGLGVGLHPSLMGESSAPSKGKTGPKFSTTKGNVALPQQRINPYLPVQEEDEAAPQHDPSIYDPSIATRKGGERKSKQLIFNQKGKFMAQANALRQQARLEEMKRRIAAETRKVEIEEASDKSFLVPAPPDVEWWDEGLLPPGQGTYEGCLEAGRNAITTPDSIITDLIQHPILLAPPQDKFTPAPKPLMLTQQEQKKLRRQRRMADMKEEQAKIRLGLIEPPAPKVKKSNMMRVLGEQAVKDPTAVEARVNREIAQRAADHEKANADRQLTKEQRAEKLQKQQEGDEARGVHISVFRVDNLSSGKHRYQVDVNAKENALTGTVVLHPEMNLIIVEGGAHSMNNFRKLMLNRIKWAENTMPLNNSNSTTFVGQAVGSSGNANKSALGEGESKQATWVSPFDDDGRLKDLSENRCVLVWEGDELARVFKRWGSRAVRTDGEAKEALRRVGMENMWTLARSK